MEEVLSELILPMADVTMEVETDIVKISVVGSGMRTQSGVAARLFQLLSDHHIPFKQVTTSEISISYTLDKKFKEQAVELIAQSFQL